MDRVRDMMRFLCDKFHIRLFYKLYSKQNESHQVGDKMWVLCDKFHVRLHHKLQSKQNEWEAKRIGSGGESHHILFSRFSL